MKTNLKKYGAFLLAVMMLFVLIPCAVLADGSTSTVTTGTVTLGAQETKEVNGITYSTVLRQGGAKLVFAVDENNTDPFVVVLEGMVDVTLAANQTLTVAYENDDENGYTNARTIKAESDAKDVALFLTAPGDGFHDSVSWSSGEVTMNGVTYEYTPDQNGGPYPRSLTFDFDKNYEIHYGSFAIGTLTVSAPDSYTDVLNGYSFVIGEDYPTEAIFYLYEDGIIELLYGLVELNKDESIYVDGAKVEADGAAYVMKSNDTIMTFGFATITDVTSENGEGVTTTLTIEDYTIQDYEEGYVAKQGDTIVSVTLLPEDSAEKLDGRLGIAVQTLTKNRSLMSHLIVSQTGSKSTFTYSEENGASFTLEKGTALVGMSKDATLIFNTDGYSKKITAEKDVEAPLNLKAGEAPVSTEGVFKVEDAPTPSVPSEHDHVWGPWMSIDVIDHVRECTVDGCDKYELLPHDWDKSLIIKEPTHTTYGEQRYVCYFCDATKTVQLEKLTQHSFDDAWSSDEENHWHACECGAKSDKAAHSFEEIVTSAALVATGDCENDAVYYKSCSVCGALSDETFVSAKAAGHSFTNYVSDGNATCSADGTKTAKCDHCDETSTVTDAGSKTAHTFGAYVSDGNATCEADGTKTAECSVCGAKDTVTDAGSKTPHSFGTYASDGNATCEADGTKTAKCELCGATDTQTDAGSQLAHTYEKGICTVCGAEDPDYVSLTWLWVSLGVIAVLGGGFAIRWFLIRKKTKT